MQTITVNASEKYDVIIGEGLLKNCGEYVKKVTKAEKIALISDDNVSGIYSDSVKSSLSEAGFDVSVFTFPHGEASKCSDTLNKIYSFLAANHFTRTDCIVALGGGVSANSGLRNRVAEEGAKRGWTCFIPEFKFTTDNAAMIAITGLFKFRQGIVCPLDAPPVSRAAEMR